MDPRLQRKVGSTAGCVVDGATDLWLFWMCDDSDWFDRFVVGRTGNQSLDGSDRWAHCGVGFDLTSGARVYFDNLLSDGWQGPKPVENLLEWREADTQKHRLEIRPTPILGIDAYAIQRACASWVGIRRGYSPAQLLCMWIYDVTGLPVPASPGRGVCSEDQARVLYPTIDLRGGRTFDECDPNSNWRCWRALEAVRSRKQDTTPADCGRGRTAAR